MKRGIIATVVFLLCSLCTMAQNSTQGMEFWFSYMENGYKYNTADWVDNTVMISAKHACSGTISKPDGSLEPIPFSVAANGITYIVIPEEYAYNENNSEVIGNKSLVLKASDTVSVYISNIATYSFDASFVLPVESLGSEYIVQCFDQEVNDLLDSSTLDNNILTSAFLIIAVEDSTLVDITPSTTTEHEMVFPGQAITIALNAGETFFVKSNYDSDWRDLSGTFIQVHDGKKVALFNGNTTTCIPVSVGNGRDHIFEQALPVDSWGQKFAVTSSEGRARDFVKITSAGDDNMVKRNGQEMVTLSRGESYVFSLPASSGSCFIETSEPSMVYLFNTTGEEPYEPYGANNGDPSMAWIPPVEQRISEITFCTFDSEYEFASIDIHYVNIVVDRDEVGNVYFDGTLIAPSEFNPVQGTPDYCFVRKNISHGTHHLSCARGLIAHVYGFGEARGYAYCVGANVISLNEKLLVNGTWSEFFNHGVYMCNDEIANLSVETNYHINGVGWAFGDGQTGEGVEVLHQYESAGDYLAVAYIDGTNDFFTQPVYDTLSVTIHVGEPMRVEESYVVCDEDAFEFYGVEYTQSGHYERIGNSVFGCDSTFILTLDMEFTPNFEVVGTHWPIGGSETHISVNEYAIQLVEPRTRLDTVLWQIDCPNWHVESYGNKGMYSTLYIHSFLLEPVTLHAWAINRCDTIHEEFFIQTSYYGMDELAVEHGFTLYPNPSDGQMMLHFGDADGLVEVEVYNDLGQMVDAFSVDASQCHEKAYLMPDLNNGLYYFVFKCNGAVLTRKVLLAR